MADSKILPHARAPMVGPGGIPTPEYYRYLQRLAPQESVTKIERIVEQLPKGGDYLSSNTTIAEGEGISVSGYLAGGYVQISLGDVVQEPGGILNKTAIDGKGRVIQSEAATTDDLPEGSTNLWFTAPRAKDAVGESLRDTSDIDLTYDSAARTIAAALTATGVTAGTYGGGVSMLVVQVDAKGRLVSVSTQALIAGSGVIFTADPVTGAVTISINTTPPSTRVTEDGSQRVTRNGDIRVTR